MKTAVVYYSLEGNTKYVADTIADKLNSDVIQLKPVKEYPKKGFAKFLHGGKSAVFEEKPALQPYTFDVTKYDAVLIGSPVWASNCAAPLNTFFEQYAEYLKQLGGAHIGVFLCQKGKGADKVLSKFKGILETDTFAAECVLIDPGTNTKNREENAATIQNFCATFMD